MKKAREKYEEMASLRTLARKILGRKGTFMLRNALSGVYTYFLRSPDHVRKERGVTAMVCTYNEEDWVDLSLLSIKDLVREIVVVDSSTDSTPEIIDELKCKYDLPVKLFRMEAGDLVTARNLVLKEATCKWILVWDADFIARPELIETIKRLIDELDERRHYLVYWQMVRICGDL